MLYATYITSVFEIMPDRRPAYSWNYVGPEMYFLSKWKYASRSVLIY